jgi:hypothetical protein
MGATKSIFASKTAWAGAIITVLGGLQALNWTQLITDPRIAGLVASGIGTLMIVLRFMTSQPVTVTGTPS